MSAKLFKESKPFAIEGETSKKFTIEFDIEDLELMRDIFHQVCQDREFANNNTEAYRIAHNLKTECNDYLYFVVVGWFGGSQVYWGNSGGWVNDINCAFRYPKENKKLVLKMVSDSKFTWKQLGYYDIEVMSLYKARVLA